MCIRDSTRIIKLGNRSGDNADMAMIELVDYNELYSQTKPDARKRRRRKKKSNEKLTTSESALTQESPSEEEAPAAEESPDPDDKVGKNKKEN